MARQIELSEDARQLIVQVSELEAQLRLMRVEFAADVANMRAEVEKELARLERARAERAGTGVAERQAARLAAETDRFIAAQQRLLADRERTLAELTELRAELDLPPLAPVGDGADGVVSGGSDWHELPRQPSELSARRQAVAEELRALAGELDQIAASRSELADERTALIAEADRRMAMERERMAAELASARAADEQKLNAERERLYDDVAQQQTRLERERAQVARDAEAFEAAIAGRRYLLAGLMGDAWADYELTRADVEEHELLTKAYPAFKAAEFVRSKRHALSEARRRAKRAEWVLAFYEAQFPWLAELRDVEQEEDYVAGETAEETIGDEDGPTDPARRWLSAEEWARLPEVERNQRALERYLASRKSPWQLGRDYERYIGYLREQDGFHVTYQGIFAGLEDLGRDLLAERDGVIEVIQCKRWARHKTIHEKHIFQLFGTVVACRIENPDKEVRGTFVTTTSLSERAHQFADALDIQVEETFPLSDYPRIKCNISMRDGERIYHLPMDQQYDTTVISPERGERWVSTTAEAEALGFRRAWRWQA